MTRSAQLVGLCTPNGTSNRSISSFAVFEAKSRLATRQAKLALPSTTKSYTEYTIMKQAAFMSLDDLFDDEILALDRQYFPEFYI